MANYALKSHRGHCAPAAPQRRSSSASASTNTHNAPTTSDKPMTMSVSDKHPAKPSGGGFARTGLLLLAACAAALLTGSVCQSVPTIMFPFPAALNSFPSLSAYTQKWGGRSQAASPMKTYSGHRVSNDSLLMIYWHDQTIAIVELGPAKLLLSCEIIEIYDDIEGQHMLLRLGALNVPLQIQFREMLQLMEQCNLVERFDDERRRAVPSAAALTASRGLHPAAGLTGVAASASGGSARAPATTATASATEATDAVQSPLTLLSGIIPGTKWCGTGDIAASYADLGAQTVMDRCCRTHDLCPAKVRAFQSRYGLKNTSLYTKSHCACDDELFACLKRTKTLAARVMGSIYFNLVQVPCVLVQPGVKSVFRKAREGF